MKKQIIALALLSILGACTRTTNHLQGKVINTVETKDYYFNSYDESYVLISKKDSFIDVMVCSMVDTTFNRLVGQQQEERDFLIKSTDKKKEYHGISAVSAILSDNSTRFKKIDSVDLWSGLSPILDTTVFDLAKDWGLLDQTFRKKTFSNPRIPIDRLKINSKKWTRKNTPSLYFEITVNQKGKVSDVLYAASFGQVGLSDLIESVKKVLLTTSLPPYSLFGKPVRVKMNVVVYITDVVT